MQALRSATVEDTGGWRMRASGITRIRSETVRMALEPVSVSMLFEIEQLRTEDCRREDQSSQDAGVKARKTIT